MVEIAEQAEKGIISKRALLIGSAGVVLAAAAAYSAVRWGSGAGEGPYLQLDWTTTATNSESIDWAIFDGHPEAGPIPRLWEHVGVIATNAAMLDQLQEKIGGIHAVAYLDRNNKVHVGFDKKGRNFFGKSGQDDDTYKTGMRIGPGPLICQKGLWQSEKGMFVPSPGGIEALRPTTTMQEMPNDYPGIKVV